MELNYDYKMENKADCILGAVSNLVPIGLITVSEFLGSRKG